MKKVFGWILLIFGIIALGSEFDDVIKGTPKSPVMGFILAGLFIFGGYKLIRSKSGDKVFSKNEKASSRTVKPISTDKTLRKASDDTTASISRNKTSSDFGEEATTPLQAAHSKYTSNKTEVVVPPIQLQQIPPVSSITNNSVADVPVPPPIVENKLLNLNSATEVQLAALPGVGPVLAKRAVSLQKQGGFKSVDHFGEILGLKSHHMERIKTLAFASPIQNNQQPDGLSGRVVDL
ncbi:MAG: helix-hairpin-helix domain-containing protein [Nitrospira sp.]|nr:helix-hairpin-helix domain-containing protein [Nitrospira sp.]